MADTETPLESWEVGETFTTHNAPTRYWETYIRVPGVGRVATTSGTSQEDAEAIAEFIVRSCNSHVELVAALRSTLSTLDFAIRKGVIECHGVREYALAALAKAQR